MPIGQSGGRSANNPQSGSIRATPRERDQIDPPGREAWAHLEVQEEKEARRSYLLNALAMGAWVFFCVLLAVVVCAWWGLV